MHSILLAKTSPIYVRCYAAIHCAHHGANFGGAAFDLTSIMKHLHVAIAIIHHSSLVLICQRRKNDSFGNLWEFPGGKVEAGETPEQCLHREIQEELGIRIEHTARFPDIEHMYPDVTVRLTPFLCRLVSGDPRPLASQRLEWVPAPRLRDYPFPAANKQLIEQILELLSQFTGAESAGNGSIDFTPRDS